MLANRTSVYCCKSLKSEKGDVVVIPPYPEICGAAETIPSLFLWFPLLGTENFGVNFIFHSERFYPVEKRNNIMLPGASQISKEKGAENERILKEIMATVFAYYADAEHAKDLGREMCQVAFPEVSDNEETERFYKEMQLLWNKELPRWKVLPAGEERVSVDDGRVRLLHPSFYKKLNEEQRKEYEPVIMAYAKEVKLNDGTPVMVPDKDLFVWSETVSRWTCESDDGFFLTIADVCAAIKSKGENLHAFLKLLIDSGNEEALGDYPLLPNREGELRTRKTLYDDEFVTLEVYALVKVMMGEEANKLFDPRFRDVISVNPYTKADLQKDINSNLRLWRGNYLERQQAEPLPEASLAALIRFCSATSIDDFKNQRGRMMPIVADFYGKEFAAVQTIKFREDEEEQFYSPAFGFLLDYTLAQICRKNATWVAGHKDWLLQFLKEFAPRLNADRLKKLDSYGVLPNQNNVLCLKSELKASRNVPDEMVEIYKAVFGKDLKEEWIDTAFDEIVDLHPVMPADVAGDIEKALVADMKQDGAHRFEKVVRQIILKIGTSEEWREWFGQIEDKKAVYTFSMKTGDAQRSLFSLMDHLDDGDMARLAKIGESGKMADLLDKLENMERQEYESAARFAHLHSIGKHIEDALRARIGGDNVKLDMAKSQEEAIHADDQQDGQDIIVKVKVGTEWTEVFYVEVKSKWDFNEAAHMSASQIRKASQNKERYALCCVDLRPYKNEDLTALAADKIIAATHVKMDIGKQLGPLMEKILEADRKSDEVQIKISDYRSNMAASVFEQGDPFETLVNKISEVAEEVLRQV